MMPATSPGPATQHTVMARACRGVIPTALNTPMSRARSLVVSTVVLTTPSAAAITSRDINAPIRMITAGKTGPVSLMPLAKSCSGLDLRPNECAYAHALVPGRSPMAYASGARPGSAPARRLLKKSAAYRVFISSVFEDLGRLSHAGFRAGRLAASGRADAGRAPGPGGRPVPPGRSAMPARLAGWSGGQHPGAVAAGQALAGQ